MERNQRVEDYMRVIYRLREQGMVRGAYIARELGVTKPTVSVALREMEAAGYLTIKPDRAIELTEKGEQIARYVIERNDVIFGLLTDIGVDKETAQADAGQIAHGISEKTLDALIDLRHYLTFIRKTPFGNIKE
ncbi:MAG: metal-dependent transcriptional regulator [Ruminococcus sp.]|nr:metal-dependent transcriptional regulator [Ruminococcus sp.]